MKDKGTLILIGILVLVGGVLGYAIYQSGALKSEQATPARQGQTGTSVSAPSTSTERTGLSGEERAALNPPGEDASEDERQRHTDLVFKLATDTDVLRISNCEPSPVVMRVVNKREFIVRNSDLTDRTIFIDEERQYVIPAQGETVLPADFGKESGIYGYGCDLSNKGVGVFLVTE